jgi:hypothetical protein
VPGFPVHHHRGCQLGPPRRDGWQPAHSPSITTNVMVAADPSTPGHCTVAGTNSSNQFVAYQTSDYGMTWRGPGAAVSDSLPFGKYHTWMSYAPDGVLGLLWKARQSSGPSGGNSTVAYNVYAAISMDGGATWSSGAVEVSDGTSPAPNTFNAFTAVSDNYSNITMRDDVAFINWADWRPGDRAGFVTALRFLDYDFSGFLSPSTTMGPASARPAAPFRSSSNSA